MKEALFLVISVLTRATRRNISEDGVLQYDLIALLLL
jgi:hypothetical protein